MSLFSSHLELEIDERILFHRGECDDGENQYTVNSPSDNGFLLAAPHVETAVADDDVGGDKERQGNPGNRRNLQLMRQGPVMEECREEIAQSAERRGTEDAPQQGDDDESLGNIADFKDHLSSFIFDFVEKMEVAEAALEDQQYAIGKAPDHEGPVRAVPDTAHGEDNQCVDGPARYGNTVATEWDVKVVAKPRRQRDVPPSPKFLHAARQIRRFEVVNQREAHRQGAAERNGGITEKVAVNLERVEQHTQKNVAAAVSVGAA